MNKNKKGQLSFVNIIFFMILVIITAIITPIISGFLDDYKTTANISDTSMNGLIVNSIVPVIWLGVVITFLLYITPVRPQEY